MTSPQHKDYQDWAQGRGREAGVLAGELPVDRLPRSPVNFVKTNSCRAMATNAMTGNMWEDFASDELSQTCRRSATIPFFNPYGGQSRRQDSDRNASIRRATRRPRRAAGRRRSGLLSRPDAGLDLGDGAVPAQQQPRHLHQQSQSSMAGSTAFDDAIRKLLWPDKRLESSSYNDATPARAQGRSRADLADH